MGLDRLYTDGGAYTVDGNYENDTTLQSALLRLLLMNRGKWPADRKKRNLGSMIYSITKDTDENRNMISRYVEEAWSPYIKTGKISNVEVSVFNVMENAIHYTASYVNRMTKQRETLTATSPWKG